MVGSVQRGNTVWWGLCRAVGGTLVHIILYCDIYPV